MTQPTLSNTLPPSSKSRRKRLGLKETRQFIDKVFGSDLHALRVLSLANGVVGLLHAAVLSIHAIGQAYAVVSCITPKSGVKQVDRLLSNPGIGLDLMLRQWVQFVVGNAPSITVALDWTDFERDDQVTLCAYMVTRHGRAMPLVWRTMWKSQLKERQTDFEFELVDDLYLWMPKDVEVNLLADRGFGNHRLYAFLDSIGWGYVIRFRENIVVRDAAGNKRPAVAWLPASGRAKMLRDARVTGVKASVPAVVVVKRRKMKNAWCLATNLAGTTADKIIKLYSKRFTIEETFRDTKDLHFGMGLSATHIGDPGRRDRLLLLVATAHTLLTLLGAASEASGLDRYLKVNTVRQRTHSLYRQGLFWYHAIPTMREDWLRRLIDEFDRIVREHPFLSFAFGLK